MKNLYQVRDQSKTLDVAQKTCRSQLIISEHGFQWKTSLSQCVLVQGITILEDPKLEYRPGSLEQKPDWELIDENKKNQFTEAFEFNECSLKDTF